MKAPARIARRAPGECSALMGSEGYIRFGQFEDVLASVELVAILAPTLDDNPLRWKWVVIAAHSAMQGAMVCAYADISNTSILQERSRRKMLAWLNTDKDNAGPMPDGWLADFMDLLKKCIRGSEMCTPLVLTRSQCRDIRRLNTHRNWFSHFKVQGLLIQQAGLPSMISVALYAVEELMIRVTLDDEQREDLRDALGAARAAL